MIFNKVKIHYVHLGPEKGTIFQEKLGKSVNMKHSENKNKIR